MGHEEADVTVVQSPQGVKEQQVDTGREDDRVGRWEAVKTGCMLQVEPGGCPVRRVSWQLYPVQQKMVKSTK